MRLRTSTILAITMLCLAATVSWADLAPYSQDFEELTPAPQPEDPFESSLADDGWLLFVNVFNAEGGFLYNYGNVFPAPNHGEVISAVVVGEGGPSQGEQQLSIFSDYRNGDHGACGGDNTSADCRFIEVNVFQEQVIGAADVGSTWRFDFQHKRGNIEGVTTALAFFKTLDPDAGFALTNFITVDMTGIPETWGGNSLEIDIDPSLEGQILQFGFLNTATNFEGSGILYDNVAFGPAPVAVNVDIKPGSCPNPINRKSRGVLPVAVLGTADFDVTNIDVDSLQLEGVAPIRWDYEDVTEPYAGDECECIEAGPDGYLDLTLKFRSQDIVAAIGPAQRGDYFTPTLTGVLLDGTPFESQDCVVVVGGGQVRVEARDETNPRGSRFQELTPRR